jgi:hypothetical protein
MKPYLKILSRTRDIYLYWTYKPLTPHKNEKIKKPLIFIIGASGSGTTMLTRILSKSQEVIGLGGNFDEIPREDKKARNMARLFHEGTRRLWDTKTDFKAHWDAKRTLYSIINDFFKLDAFVNATHFLHKRSAPFWWSGDRYRPDMTDLFDMFEDIKVIVIYRDPKSSTYSSLRRGFFNNLRESAVICEEQLTYINAQIQWIDIKSRMIINYEEFCEHPVKMIKDIAAFCKLDQETLIQATLDENVKPTQIDRWKNSLSREEIDNLDAFFNEIRIAQWHSLTG